MSAIDTGEGLYYPIVNGTGAPGSAVSATQAASAAPAVTRGSGGLGVSRPALAHRASFVATAAVTRKSTTTVASNGRFTLGPLSWIQPDADGDVHLTITQQSPTGGVTTTTVTVKLPKPTLALSAPRTSSGSQLTITGVKGATVAIRFSDGTQRQVALDGSGHGTTAIPSGATSATVVYAGSGRFGPAQTVQLSNLPVSKPASEPAGGSGHGSGHGGASGAPTPSDSPTPTPSDSPTPTPTPSDSPTPISRPVTGVSVDTGPSNELFPIISGTGVAGSTVYAVVGDGQPDATTPSAVVDSNGHFELPELDGLSAGTTTVTLYQREAGSTSLSSGVPTTVSLTVPSVTISSSLLSAQAVIVGVPGAQVAVSVQGISLPSQPPVVQLDPSGQYTINLGPVSLGVSVTVNYVGDGATAGRSGPTASASSLITALSTTKDPFVEILEVSDRIVRLALREV